ncbi:uncharacterized protein EV420DRAFT_356537 [Desarmillaria tabescens]|uniref:Uncharacterized protein n=1 Tax=Armillaria tabescens TaxID=1929756 RepID=A0AA39KC66_ARMTA|nr:uncharacterized protein EV420DRAFT_356537 [Desarmillaria tabescens]KAK0458466.1 hypothetical protein EV420DRAFT_356537 [Desarmillaria tabescens]
MRGCRRKSWRWRSESGTWRIFTGIRIHHHTGRPEISPLPTLYLWMYDLQVYFTDQTRVVIHSLATENGTWPCLLPSVMTANISYSSDQHCHSSGSQQREARSKFPHLSTPMNSPFFQLCTLLVLIPLVLTLDITLDGAPVAFKSTPVVLHRMQDDPPDFILGAFLIHTDESLMVATTTQAVNNFIADLTAFMTFNYTSTSDKDCILIAWIPGTEPHNQFTQSEPFSVGSKPRTATSSFESIPAEPTFKSNSSTTPNPTTPSPFPSVVGSESITSNVPPEHVSRAGAIVGGVLGSVLVLGCMVSTAIYVFIRRRRPRGSHIIASSSGQPSANSDSIYTEI